MDPYIKELSEVIRKTSMTNTYKMVWIRSIWGKFTKPQFIKLVQSLRNPNIEVIDVWERGHKSKLTQHFDKMIGKGNFTVIFLKE